MKPYRLLRKHIFPKYETQWLKTKYFFRTEEAAYKAKRKLEKESSSIRYKVVKVG